jgi:ComF family protein
MSFESSAIARRLSNFRHAILNKCVRFGQAALPQHCALCSGPATNLSLCAHCYAELPWLAARHCPQCALPVTNGNVCGACLRHPPRFDAITAAFTYAWPIAPLLQQYKYAGNLALAQTFAHCLVAKITREVDFIIPMPLAPARLAERGFNQALEIARIVSRDKNMPLAATACRRVRESAPQAMLPWKERARNVRGAFVCDIDLRGLRVAMVDDVMTTGATLNELARSLRKAGAAEIHGWVIARTDKPG